MAENTKLTEKQRDYKTLSPSKVPLPPIKPKLEEVELAEESQKKKKRVPRRVIHCSDGVIEEYSTDEEEIEARKQEEEKQRQQSLIDPRTLTWIPWVLHYTWLGGSTMLSYCDSWGERLAWLFGITSPKYYYELEEFKRMQEEEQERKKQEQEQNQGWTNEQQQQQPVVEQQQPIATIGALQTQELHSKATEEEEEEAPEVVDFDPESQRNHY